MPTYEYKCKGCEEAFEIFQKISEDPLKSCPVCGGELKRIISGGAGIIFKGSGFYTTDYKNSSSSISSPSSEEKKNEEKNEEKKSESKSENKKEETKKQTVSSDNS